LGVIVPCRQYHDRRGDEGSQTGQTTWQSTADFPERQSDRNGAGSNGMDMILLNALVSLMPMSLLFSDSAVLFCRRKDMSSLLQLIGAACLVVVHHADGEVLAQDLWKPIGRVDHLEHAVDIDLLLSRFLLVIDTLR
jgi:hypothetical protein